MAMVAITTKSSTSGKPLGGMKSGCSSRHGETGLRVSGPSWVVNCSIANAENFSEMMGFRDVAAEENEHSAFNLDTL
jgi:hypothetical protein